MNKNHQLYIALGTNLGDRLNNLQEALRQMAEFVLVDKISSIYETPPAYVTDQPAFLNGVCRAQTDLSPHELLDQLEIVMTALGRKRTLRYGPRIIDLDILFYDDLVIETEALTIPHPRLVERDFVLEPLCEIAPELHHPTLGENMETLWKEIGAEPLPKFQEGHTLLLNEE